jgi:SpoVK/Ycf46/Vps4 family AAA+-type ATPase
MDEETKDTVRHLVSLSGFKPQSASEFLLRHVRITGAMFYGPPGTGKTHLSRAIAKASGSNLLAIDSATIQSKWVGETEKYIKAAFTLSTKLYPCVLFIDEVDSLFYRRSSNDTSWQRSALAQFLSEMDGVSRSEKAPFVVVATNRPADLDEAFYRRLPQKIFFKLPDADSRARILNLFLMKEDLDENVDVAALARQTEGYSGSDLRNLCAEAALLWAIEQVRDIPLNKEEGEGAHGQIGMKKLKLELGHFTKALKKIRPSVSGQVIKELQEFAERFSLELPKPKPKPNPNGIVFHSMVNRSMKY